MTILNLQLSWLLFLDDGATLAAKTTDRAPATSIEGDVVGHAGGRQRAYSVEGESKRYPVTFVNITRAQRALLENRKGATVLFRDPWGEVLYGTFFDTAVVYEYEKGAGFSVRIEVRGVTVVEGV